MSIFNHLNFSPPDNNITGSLFGLAMAALNKSLGSGGANGGLNPLYPNRQPARELQF